MRRLLCASVFLLALAGCLGGDATGPTDPQDLAYAPALNVDFSRMTKTSEGLWYEDLVVGTGPVSAVGDSVGVLYTFWLPNGSLIESATNPSTPYRFVIGLSQVILGFDIGLLGIPQGSKRKLVIPPSLGYGGLRVGDIPPNSTLVFDVELVRVIKN
jgi:FKBP-type peptidyl-prolyl cis-trans isomerase